MSTPTPARERPWSMTARLVLLQTCAVAALLGVALLTLYVSIARHLEKDNRAELDNQVAVLARWLADMQPALPGQGGGSDPLATLPLQLRIWNPGHDVIYRSPRSQLPPPETFPPAGAPAQESNDPEESRLLLKSAWLRSPTNSDPGLLMQVGYDVSDDLALLGHLRERMALVYGLTVLASALIALLIARGVFRPVARLAAAASRVQASQLTARIDEAGWPEELTALAREFDAMLARLDDSFRRLSRFSSDLSHELRTPINILRGEAEVALSRPRPPEEYRQVLESSLEECARLSRLIDTLLFIAKADNPAEGIKRRSVDAAAECRAVAEFFEAAAAERGLTILVRGTASVYCDPELLRRALANLVDNAVRHTDAGGHIDLTAREVGPQGTEIEVRDDGHGIPPADLPRIFERFYRSERTPGQAPLPSGFGLGLAIIKSIMDLHGGTVNIVSDGRTGTIVTLGFPTPPGKMTEM